MYCSLTKSDLDVSTPHEWDCRLPLAFHQGSPTYYAPIHSKHYGARNFERQVPCPGHNTIPQSGLELGPIDMVWVV